MAAHNQFQVYLPDDIALPVREGAEQGRYVIKDVMRTALINAQAGTPAAPTMPDNDFAEVQQTMGTMLRDAGYDPGGDGDIVAALRSLIEDVRDVQNDEPTPTFSVPLPSTVAPETTALNGREFYAPAVGEPSPQRVRWFTSLDELQAWLLTASDRGERIESLSYDPTGESILALITDVVVVLP